MANFPRTFLNQTYRQKRRKYLRTSKQILKSISDTLVLIDTITTNKANSRTINQTLIFNESLIKNKVNFRTVVDTLTFNEAIIYYNHSFYDTLVFDESIVLRKKSNHRGDFSFYCYEDTLSLHETFSYTKNKRRIILEKLKFQECFEYDLRHYSDVIYVGTNNHLTFTEHFTTSKGNILVRNFTEGLIFHESLSNIKGGFYNSHIVESLIFNEQFLTNKYKVSDNIVYHETFTGTTGNLTYHSVSDVLTLTEHISTTGIVNNPVNQTLTFTEAIDHHRVIFRQLSDTLVLHESTVKQRVINKKIKQKLVFTENIIRNNTYNFTITDNLVFLHYIPKILNHSIVVYEPEINYTLSRDHCPCP